MVFKLVQIGLNVVRITALYLQQHPELLIQGKLDLSLYHAVFMLLGGWVEICCKQHESIDLSLAPDSSVQTVFFQTNGGQKCQA